MPQHLGNQLFETYNKMEPGAARIAFRKGKYTDIMAVRQQFDPKNANTLAAGLVNDAMADALLVAFTQKLAPLGKFSSRFLSDTTEAPRKSIDVPLAISGSTTLTNPTDFETGDSNLGVVTVPMTAYSQPFHMDANATLQGYKLDQIMEVNALKLADTLSDVITGLMVVGNFATTALVAGAAASFAAAGLRPILAAGKNFSKKLLLLDGGHLSYLLPVDRTNFQLGEPGAYGFDGIFEQNKWTGATANSCGFICSPDAIAVAAQPVNNVPSRVVDSVSTTMTQQGITVTKVVWASSKTRASHCSYDVVFGAITGIGSQGVRIVTA